MGFVWHELLTSDVAAARRFYGEVIGWRTTPHALEDYSEFRAGDEAVAGLMDMAEEAGIATPMWLGYIAVTDVDATVESVERDGAVLVVPPDDIPDVGRFAMFLDPQGAATYVIRLAANAGDPGLRAASASGAARAGHCQWNELLTTDPAAALAFYTRQFGWRAGESLPLEAQGDCQLLLKDGERFAAILKRGRQGVQSAWRFYFNVDDIDRGIEAIHAGGGRILAGPHPTPGGGFGAVACDPQGAEFGIAGPARP